MSNETKPAYKVADISLADWGRKEIELAEREMPGGAAAVEPATRQGSDPTAKRDGHRGRG